MVAAIASSGAVDTLRLKYVGYRFTRVFWWLVVRRVAVLPVVLVYGARSIPPSQAGIRASTDARPRKRG